MANSTQTDWRDVVTAKLIEVFQGKEEDLIRILFYLSEEDKAYNELDDGIPPAWRTLKTTMNLSLNTFTQYALRLAEDTKKCETDVEFRKTMNTIYSQMMDASENPLPENVSQNMNWALLAADAEKSSVVAFGGLARAWSRIPADSQMRILEMIPAVIGNRQIIRAVDDAVSLVNRAGGTVVMVALAAVTLATDIIRNVQRYWKGEISGVRCVKNILDSLATIAAGVVGGMGGAAIGSAFGPLGTLAGGLIGGFAASELAAVISDRMTQAIFGIPQEVALENAYNYFGVKMTASNSEINTSFRKLCLKHHPDKGGSSDDFLMTQLHMSTIKHARGEL